MKCPECNRNGRVLEKRDRDDGTTRRRYECSQGHRWTTAEQVDSHGQRALPPALRREIGLSTGSARAAAIRYGVCHQTVTRLRQEFSGAA